MFFLTRLVNETCLATDYAQLGLGCFQIGNCPLIGYPNTIEDLSLITGEKTVKLGFNENYGCFDKTNSETISYSSNLTYTCSQESSSGIITDVSITFYVMNLYDFLEHFRIQRSKNVLQLQYHT